MALFGEKYGDTRARRRRSPRLQPRAVRRHARARHRRHRPVRDHRRSRASRPACAASRRSPAPAPTSTTRAAARLRSTAAARARRRARPRPRRRVERLQADVKRLTRELQDAKVKAAMGGGAARERPAATIGRPQRRHADRPPGRRARPGRLAHVGRSLKDELGVRRGGPGLRGRRQGGAGGLGHQGPDRQSRRRASWSSRSRRSSAAAAAAAPISRKPAVKIPAKLPTYLGRVAWSSSECSGLPAADPQQIGSRSWPRGPWQRLPPLTFLRHGPAGCYPG